MYNKSGFTIPAGTMDNWQKIVNLLVDIMGISAGFITKVSGEKVKIIKASAQENIELKEGDTFKLADVFCREAIEKQELVKIQDARKLRTGKKKQNPESELQFIAYLGIPIFYPHSQQIFGTLCVADTKPRKFSASEENLLQEFKQALENQLENFMIYHELEQQAELTRSSLNSLTASIAVIDEEGIIRYTNQAWDNFARENQGDISKTGKNVSYLETVSRSAANDRQAKEALQGIKAVLAHKKNVFTMDYPCHSPEKQRWYRMRVKPFQGRGPYAAIIAHENITARKIRKRKLQQEKARFESLFYNSPDAIIMLDEKARILEANKKFVDLFKYEPENIRGQNVDDTLKIENKEGSVDRKLTEKLFQGKQISREVTRFDREGNPLDIFLKTVPITIEGEVVGAYGIYVDITERKEKEKQLQYKTFHDELTGLYNRTFLAEQMDMMNTERQHPLSIIMVDVNGLKIINDSFGHDRGDAILKKSADILKSVVREEDVIARYGGDEFVLLLNNTSNETAHAIYERIEDKCAETNADEFPVSLGMGIATKKNVEEDINQVLKRADDSMIQNKLVSSKSHKNRIVKGLLNALGAKSDETREHALRMTRLAHQLGEKIGIANSELNRLSLLATLHDIGKTSIPEQILNKPGDLTAEEWEMIKKHPERGYKIASASEEFTSVAEEILAHHERWDGNGYPRGLIGTKIPLMARIISIVDAYDVMTSGRPYKKALGRKQALAEITHCAGSQFDPELAENFVEMMGG